MARKLSLDVSAPDEVSYVLRETADSYHESAGELASAWGDSQTGKVWDKIAQVLERAADRIDNILKTYY